ncbi:unnamed protein product [Tilletia caries]|nr:unnamed protein product [Tilletia caries]
MLVQLQLIWFQTIQHANYFAIAAMMWSIFALISNLVYLHFSLRLIRTLRTHLRMGGPKAGPIQNAMTMSMGIFSDDTAAADEEEDHLNQSVQSRTAGQTLGGTSTIASSNIIRSQVAATIEDARSPCEEKESFAGLSPPSPPSPVLPPSKPMILPACAHREGSSSVTRAVLYFIIQSASLNLGTFFFLTVMFVSGIVTVAQAEQGHFLNTINTCQMLLAFICVVFGTTTLLSM